MKDLDSTTDPAILNLITNNARHIIFDKTTDQYTARLLYFEFKRRLAKLTNKNFKYILPKITIENIPQVIYLDQTSNETILDLIKELKPDIENNFGKTCINCNTPNINYSLSNFYKYATCEKISLNDNLISDNPIINTNELKNIWKEIKKHPAQNILFHQKDSVLGLSTENCSKCHEKLIQKNNCLILDISNHISFEHVTYSNFSNLLNITRINIDPLITSKISDLSSGDALKILISLTDFIPNPLYFIIESEEDLKIESEIHTYIQIKSNHQKLKETETILQSLNITEEIAEFYSKLTKAKELGIKKSDFIKKTPISNSITYKNLKFADLPTLTAKNAYDIFSHLRKTSANLTILIESEKNNLKLGYPTALNN